MWRNDCCHSSHCAVISSPRFIVHWSIPQPFFSSRRSQSHDHCRLRTRYPRFLLAKRRLFNSSTSELDNHDRSWKSWCGNRKHCRGCSESRPGLCMFLYVMVLCQLSIITYLLRDSDTRCTRVHHDAWWLYNAVLKLNIYIQVKATEDSRPIFVSLQGCPRTLQRWCSRRRRRGLARFHLIFTGMKFSLYSTQSLKSWTPVKSFKEKRYVPFT